VPYPAFYSKSYLLKLENYPYLIDSEDLKQMAIDDVNPQWTKTHISDLQV
jgi:hypothetical protein